MDFFVVLTRAGKRVAKRKSKQQVCARTYLLLFLLAPPSSHSRTDTRSVLARARRLPRRTPSSGSRRSTRVSSLASKLLVEHICTKIIPPLPGWGVTKLIYFFLDGWLLTQSRCYRSAVFLTYKTVYFWPCTARMLKWGDENGELCKLVILNRDSVPYTEFWTI